MRDADEARKCRDEGLGAKFDQLYQDALPRAAPQIRPSAPAEKYLKDPPTGEETFRKPLHKGFDFALFNQKARRIAYASGAAHPTGSSSTGGSANMHQQPAVPPVAVAVSSFYRATTLPTPTSDRVKLPLKQPSAEVQNTPVHAGHDQASPTSSGQQSPSPLAPRLERAHQSTPASPPALPAPRAAEPPKPQPQMPSLVSRPKVPTPTPAFDAAHRTSDRHTLDNYTKDSVLSYLDNYTKDSAPLDTTMPEPLAVAEPPPEPARRPDTSASTSSSRLRTYDAPTESDAGVAGNSISRLHDRIAEDFGSPKRAQERPAIQSQLSTTDMRSATMPPLFHAEGSGVTEDSNCVVSEIISSQPGKQQYVPSTVAEESAAGASTIEDEATEPVPAPSDVVSSASGADAPPDPPAAAAPADPQDAQLQPPAPDLQEPPNSAPVGEPVKQQAEAAPTSATSPAGGVAAGMDTEEAAMKLLKADGPHTMALKMLAGGPPGAATISFKDCAPRYIVRQASDLISTRNGAAAQDTMAVVREAQRKVQQPSPSTSCVCFRLCLLVQSSGAYVHVCGVAYILSHEVATDLLRHHALIPGWGAGTRPQLTACASLKVCPWEARPVR